MYNTKKFKQLEAEWDKKLKDSGFEDAEQRSGHLKVWSHRFVVGAEVNMEAKLEYYRAAGHFLHEYQFPNTVERRIWELHAEGEGRHRIVAALRAENLWFERKPRSGLKPRPCSFSVQQILEKLQAEMTKRLNNDRQKDSQE